MSTFTYVVDHKDPPTTINFKQKVEGGELMGFMLDDALTHLGLVEDLLESIRVNTSCSETAEAIESGMAKIDTARKKRIGY